MKKEISCAKVKDYVFFLDNHMFYTVYQNTLQNTHKSEICK